jgi:transposase
MSNGTRTVQAEIVIGGIDAHADTHHVVALDLTGKMLGDHPFPASSRGYRDALDWLAGFGVIDKIGVESTGSYAAGMTRFLLGAGIDVVEVNQPHPHLRSRRGKNDTVDAEAAARKALSGQAAAVPKITTGVVESIRVLRVARDSAVRSRTRTIVQLRSLLVTAPAELRERLTDRSATVLVARCVGLRADLSRLDDPLQATKRALRIMARRIQMLDEEIAEADAPRKQLVRSTAPTLTSKLAIGPGHAAQLLITAGQNIDRLHSEAAFARLCGVAPIPVSSGKTHRMRLHRGGDRQANAALHMIAVCRMRYHQPTIDYVRRRLAEGLSKKDVLRCLKRFIAREVYHDLKTDLALT